MRLGRRVLDFVCLVHDNDLKLSGEFTTPSRDDVEHAAVLAWRLLGGLLGRLLTLIGTMSCQIIASDMEGVLR